MDEGDRVIRGSEKPWTETESHPAVPEVSPNTSHHKDIITSILILFPGRKLVLFMRLLRKHVHCIYRWRKTVANITKSGSLRVLHNIQCLLFLDATLIVRCLRILIRCGKWKFTRCSNSEHLGRYSRTGICSATTRYQCNYSQ